MPGLAYDQLGLGRFGGVRYSRTVGATGVPCLRLFADVAVADHQHGVFLYSVRRRRVRGGARLLVSHAGDAPRFGIRRGDHPTYPQDFLGGIGVRPDGWNKAFIIFEFPLLNRWHIFRLVNGQVLVQYLSVFVYIIDFY